MRFLLLAVAVVAALLLRSPYLMNLMIVIGLQALPALGLALIAGYTGQISLGHAAFYGLGAYMAALAGLNVGLSPFLGIALAALVVAGLAWYIGWLVFRLQGHHLAMATLAFGIIVQVGFVEMRGLTGGPNGLPDIPPLSLLGVPLATDVAVLPVVAVVCAAALWLAQNLIASPLGLAMRAVAADERVAASVGHDVQQVKRIVMLLSGGLAATGGGLYAHYIGYISPGPFDVGFSIRLVLMVAVGGFSSVWGVLFGVAFITLVDEVLKPLGAYDVVVNGALLVLVVIFFPRGLLLGLRRPFTRSQVRRLGAPRKAPTP